MGIKQLGNWVVILKTEHGNFVWSKYQNEYFWGGIGHDARLYSEYYAKSIAELRPDLEAVTEEQFSVYWKFNLSGKDRFDGL